MLCVYGSSLVPSLLVDHQEPGYEASGVDVAR